MNVKIKGILHFIVSIGGNAAIFGAVPEEFRVYVALGFNILQVVYAYLDPTYAINLIKMGKMDQLGNRING